MKIQRQVIYFHNNKGGLKFAVYEQKPNSNYLSTFSLIVIKVKKVRDTPLSCIGEDIEQKG